MRRCYPTLTTSPLVSFYRRSPRGYYCLFLVVLSFFIFRPIITQKNQYLPDLYSNHGPYQESPKPEVLANSSREVRPQDDEAPLPHEPAGIGTLRDVREDKFYRGGSLTLTCPAGDHSYPKPTMYDPYPDYNGDQWRKIFEGTFKACEGPRGKPLNRRNPQDMISVYFGIPEGGMITQKGKSLQTPDQSTGFPPPLLGSYSAIGLDAHICTDRSSRLGMYGYGQNDSHASSASELSAQVNWNEVNWGSLQSKCFETNADRYHTQRQADVSQTSHILSARSATHARNNTFRDSSGRSFSGLQYKTRSAVILRAWHKMKWTEDLKQNVRSLIMELSLHSGGEYELFILCHVQDENIPFYADDVEAMRSLKAQFIPREFLDITVLFNNRALESWYPKIEEHSIKYQYWQAVQIFSQQFQDFDYYWQLEMDSRLISHAYHFLEQSATFAQEQPRKYLWERNAYFYIPGKHGAWPDFMNMVDSSVKGRESVWGPRSISQITPAGPQPPVASPEDDDYKWGIDEEADLITLLPIFDPAGTKWTFPDALYGLPVDIPRRASPVAMGRVSKLLMQQMHDAESQQGIGLASEMTPASLALWHGLKAVHVPHPLYIDGKWTSKELGRILNPGSPENINGGDDSFWNWDHRWDHILYRFSYMFTTQTAEDLYRRWLGYKIDPNQYTDGSRHQDPQGRNWFESGDLREDLYGPLCFPPMLLHTVKNTAEKKGPDMAVPV